MRLDYCPTILHVSVLAALLFPLDADSKDSACESDIRVQRGTVYNALLGEDYQIDCPVTFCNNSPPTVSWHKYETTKYVPVDVSSSRHVKTGWTLSKPLEGISHLIFQKILRNDSGEYQCRTGSGMSHNINISVYDMRHSRLGPDGERNVTQNDTSEVQLTNVTRTILEPEPTEGTFWLFEYCVVGIMGFVIIIVLTVWVASKYGCKGQSMDTPDLSHQPSHDAFTTITIYENVK